MCFISCAIVHLTVPTPQKYFYLQKWIKSLSFNCIFYLWQSFSFNFLKFWQELYLVFQNWQKIACSLTFLIVTHFQQGQKSLELWSLSNKDQEIIAYMKKRYSSNFLQASFSFSMSFLVFQSWTFAFKSNTLCKKLLNHAVFWWVLSDFTLNLSVSNL